MFFHGLATERFGHFFKGVTKGGAGHGFFMPHYKGENFFGVPAGGFLEEPAIAFLHQIIGVG